METHTLVIGSGVAGLTFAIKMATEFPHKKVTIVTKAAKGESNTKYAQGGVAVVSDLKEDSYQNHIQDTLTAGDGLCDPEIVAMVVKEGPLRLAELMRWGANFDRDTSGKLNLGKEGGHSEYRVVHHKDITGFEIERALLKQIAQLPNIVILPYHFTVDLITEHHFNTTVSSPTSCYGAYVMDEKSGHIFPIKATSTLLATGGMGRLYGHTTNPLVATGDGIAMAYRAKADIEDMEFIQFHPTALYEGKEGPAFLISEAVRGFGAFLRNGKGDRFMPKYHPKAELASRDIVGQNIDRELKKSGDSHVFLDGTHLEMTGFKKHFPNIYKRCLEAGYALEKDMIPVVPAAHYLCGGIKVDRHGRTSIRNLFACGECTRTGLHGANRLASNSILEAVVYAHNSFLYHKANPLQPSPLALPPWKDNGNPFPYDQNAIEQQLKALQALMRTSVGIVRSQEQLKKAEAQLAKIYQEVTALYNHSKMSPRLCELRNMVNLAHLIIGQSLERTTNKGGYYNVDLIGNTEKIRDREPLLTL